jgi:hypothetical protein
MTNLEQWIADAEARAEKATEGPWAWELVGEKSACFHVGVAFDKNDKPVLGRTETERYDEEKDIFVEDVIWREHVGENEDNPNLADADFIAHARTDQPAALKLLRKALAVVEAARRYHDEMTDGDQALGKCEVCDALAAFDHAAKEVTGE